MSASKEEESIHNKERGQTTVKGKKRERVKAVSEVK